MCFGVYTFRLLMLLLSHLCIIRCAPFFPFYARATLPIWLLSPLASDRAHTHRYIHCRCFEAKKKTNAQSSYSIKSTATCINRNRLFQIFSVRTLKAQRANESCVYIEVDRIAACSSVYVCCMYDQYADRKIVYRTLIIARTTHHSYTLWFRSDSSYFDGWERGTAKKKKQTPYEQMPIRHCSIFNFSIFNIYTIHCVYTEQPAHCT